MAGVVEVGAPYPEIPADLENFGYGWIRVGYGPDMVPRRSPIARGLQGVLPDGRWVAQLLLTAENGPSTAWLAAHWNPLGQRYMFTNMYILFPPAEKTSIGCSDRLVE